MQLRQYDGRRAYYNEDNKNGRWVKIRSVSMNSVDHTLLFFINKEEELGLPGVAEVPIKMLGLCTGKREWGEGEMSINCHPEGIWGQVKAGSRWSLDIYPEGGEVERLADPERDSPTDKPSS